MRQHLSPLRRCRIRSVTVEITYAETDVPRTDRVELD